MSKNDITGDSIVTKQYSESYGNGYERIYGITCKRCGKRGLQHNGVHTCSPQIKEAEHGSELHRFTLFLHRLYWVL